MSPVCFWSSKKRLACLSFFQTLNPSLYKKKTQHSITRTPLKNTPKEFYYKLPYLLKESKPSCSPSEGLFSPFLYLACLIAVSRLRASSSSLSILSTSDLHTQNSLCKPNKYVLKKHFILNN